MTDFPSDHRSQPTNAGPWSLRFRLPLAVAVYSASFAVALFGAFGLAYNFHRMSLWFTALYLPLLALALPIKLVIFGWMNQYRGSWRYVGLYDLFGLVRAAWLSSIILVAVFFVIENLWQYWFGHYLIDRDLDMQLRQSVFLLDWAGTIGVIAAWRIAVRFYAEEVHAQPYEKQSRVLIIGAGDTGEAVLREILRMPSQRYVVVGFLDDQPGQVGRTIHGVEVLGTLNDITEICDRHLIDELLLALPEATPRELRRVVEICEGNNLRFRILPGVADVMDGRLHVSHIRDVEIADLLGRAPVQLDADAIASGISGRSIIVTGAGGSIGSEMCRQVVRFNPAKLILVEQAENNLFEIDRELRSALPELTIVPCVADICDAPRIHCIFEAHRPTTIFHAAAHKHVPMMELNVGESIKNNILGTRIIADAAAEFAAHKMVVISTDKAVNPTSVMGCTKRVAELYVQQLSDHCDTQFITVRFGNVLGSSGSVVPIFREQIARGGPVCVTHPDMVRYFMTIPEAAQLVLQAGSMGSGGEIYLLDMGDPIKIVDLARDMITLSGLRPGIDIEIVYTGLRPGEKLFEELSIEGEHVSPTRHPKIGVWKHRPEDFDRICKGMEELIEAADTATPDTLRLKLRELVPEFEPEAPLDAATVQRAT
jgi:FlaA1/EpsC-like NDP-sugar epimerase